MKIAHIISFAFLSKSIKVSNSSLQTSILYTKYKLFIYYWLIIVLLGHFIASHTQMVALHTDIDALHTDTDALHTDIVAVHTDIVVKYSS